MAAWPLTTDTHYYLLETRGERGDGREETPSHTKCVASSRTTLSFPLAKARDVATRETEQEGK